MEKWLTVSGVIMRENFSLLYISERKLKIPFSEGDLGGLKKNLRVKNTIGVKN